MNDFTKADDIAVIPVGQGVLQRLLFREHTRHQARLLRHLSRLPVGQYITLCGAAALHGVYLHKRPSRDLDFYAPYIVLRRFQEMTRHLGLPLDPGRAANTYEWSPGSRLIPELRIAIRLYGKEETLSLPQRRAFGADIGEKADVKALSLPELLAAKANRLDSRGSPVDYVDLWLGLRSRDDIVQEVRQALAPPAGRRANSFGGPIDAGRCLARLAQLEPVWGVGLSTLVFPVPPFEQVRAELGVSLPELATVRR